MIFLFLFTVMCLYLLKRRHSALSAGFQAELELSQLPVVLGQGCSALIRFREEVEISCVDELELGLLHEDKVAFGSRARTGLDFETKESLVEGSFIKIDFELIDIGRQSALKFVINLPENLACTDLDGDFPKSWKLILKSKQSDLNFYEEFKIPVFELGEGVTAQINSKFPI
jgi:hypothetical protein